MILGMAKQNKSTVSIENFNIDLFFRDSMSNGTFPHSCRFLCRGRLLRRPVSNPSLTLTLSRRAREKYRRPLVVKNIVGVGSKPTLLCNHARKSIRRGRRPRRPVSNSSLTLTLSQRAREKTDASFGCEKYCRGRFQTDPSL